MEIQILATMVFTLFLIVDPIALIPLLPEMTKDNTVKEKKIMIRRAILVAFLVLMFFTLLGRILLGYFGVSIAAVRIAGGILLFGIGIEMLYGRVTKTESTEKVGEYDLIIEVETDSEENLQLFVKNELRSIPFIEKTMPVVLQY